MKKKIIKNQKWNLQEVLTYLSLNLFTNTWIYTWVISLKISLEICPTNLSNIQINYLQLYQISYICIYRMTMNQINSKIVWNSIR